MNGMHRMVAAPNIFGLVFADLTLQKSILRVKIIDKNVHLVGL